MKKCDRISVVVFYGAPEITTVNPTIIPAHEMRYLAKGERGVVKLDTCGVNVSSLLTTYNRMLRSTQSTMVVR